MIPWMSKQLVRTRRRRGTLPRALGRGILVRLLTLWRTVLEQVPERCDHLFVGGRLILFTRLANEALESNQQTWIPSSVSLLLDTIRRSTLWLLSGSCSIAPTDLARQVSQSLFQECQL
eukprot:7606677-Pyramimonas_sp.AAC.1